MLTMLKVLAIYGELNGFGSINLTWLRAAPCFVFFNSFLRVLVPVQVQEKVARAPSSSR